MIVAALALALGAAVFHTVWNVLLKGNADPLRLSVQAQVSATALITPIAAFAWLVTGRPVPPPSAWLLALISSLAELAYFIFLSRAYRTGDLSTVYPLARGTAPVLAVSAGIAILGEHPTTLQLSGIVLLLAGVWIVRRPSGTAKGVVPALLTGLAIASYTTIDRVGVRLTEAWIYAWMLAVLTAAFLLLAQLIRTRSGRGQSEGVIVSWRVSILVGLLMLAAYFMVLIALTLAPLSVVAPARESAVALVAAWGVIRLRERSGIGLRGAGVAAILAGIALLAA